MVTGAEQSFGRVGKVEVYTRPRLTPARHRVTLVSFSFHVGDKKDAPIAFACNQIHAVMHCA